MEDDQQALCDAVGQAIVAGDLDAVHALFAPWVRATLSPAQIAEQLDSAADGLEHPPVSWTADEGFAGLDDLRKPDSFGPPSKGLPKEVTAGNFRGWLCIQFAPAEDGQEDQNVCYDVWIAAVDQGGTLRVGYFEPWEAS
jgi:hypothetical protein